MKESVKYEFEKTCEYLYSRVADEIDNKIKSANLKNQDVDIERETLVSRIRNNKRDNAINRNLIPYCIMNNLQEKLKFASTRELFWGNDDVIYGYAVDLFEMMMLDILLERHEDPLYKSLHGALIDYVPFAQWVTYEKFSAVLSDDNTIFFFGYEKSVIMHNADSARINAIARLYSKVFDEIGFSIEDVFISKLIEITHQTRIYSKKDLETKERKTEVNNRGFYKLSKRLQDFSMQELLSIFDALSTSKESLGKRAYSLLMADVPPVLNHFISIEQSQSEYSNISNNKSFDKLLIASGKYVEELNKIQSNDERYDWAPPRDYL